MRTHRTEVLREVWRIAERRDGCVYKTEYVEDRWVPQSELNSRPDGDPDLMWVSKTDPNVNTIRRVSCLAT